MSKRATSTARVPVRVHWTCPNCGKENDAPHTLTFTGTYDAVFTKDDVMKERARENLSKTMDKELARFQEGKLQNAHLDKLECAQCSAKAPWAQYSHIPVWAFYCLLAGFIGLFINYILLNNPILYTVCIAVALVPVIICAIITKIKNVATDREVQALPEECRPKFFLQK